MLFPLYLNRLQFLTRSIVVSLLPIPIELYLITTDFQWSLAQVGALCLYLAISIYWIAYVALPRARDIGLSRGLSLGLCLFPGLNLAFSLFLLFTKSDTYAMR